MDRTFAMVVESVVPVFGLVGLSYLYSRRVRPDYTALLRIAAQFFIPCLVFSSVLQAEVGGAEIRSAVLATWIQIGMGLVVGILSLRLRGWGERRELLLPIAFVNSANLPFPIVLSQFGKEGLSYGVACFLTTNWTIFTLGNLLLHGRGRWREGFREPVLWTTIAAFALRFSGVALPPAVLGIPDLAGQAAIPLMLVLLGDALARTRFQAPAVAWGGAALRYLSGALALAVTLAVIRPEGTLRSVLTLYALLPSAVVNVVLVQRAGRDAAGVAGVVLASTLVAVLLIPWLLALGGAR